jgi:hypothetical protein
LDVSEVFWHFPLVHQVVAKLALKAGCGLIAPSNHSTFHRAWVVSGHTLPSLPDLILPRAFLGSLVGALVGLFALLLGALFNARQNRKRDDRLRAEERRSVATEAIGVELPTSILLRADEARGRSALA